MIKLDTVSKRFLKRVAALALVLVMTITSFSILTFAEIDEMPPDSSVSQALGMEESSEPEGSSSESDGSGFNSPEPESSEESSEPDVSSSRDESGDGASASRDDDTGSSREEEEDDASSSQDDDDTSDSQDESGDDMEPPQDEDEDGAQDEDGEAEDNAVAATAAALAAAIRPFAVPMPRGTGTIDLKAANGFCEPSDAFQSAYVSVALLSDNGLKTAIAFNGALSNDYLYNTIVSAISSGLLSQASFDNEAEYCTYLDGLTDAQKSQYGLTPISLSARFSQSDFGSVDLTDLSDPTEITDDDGHAIGFYTWEEDGGDIVYEVVYNACIYSHNNVSIGGEHKFDAPPEAAPGGSVTGDVDGGVIALTYSEPDVSLTDPAANYAVEKSTTNATNETVDVTYIEYKVVVNTATSTDAVLGELKGKLNDKVFADILPQNLEFATSSLQVVLTTGTGGAEIVAYNSTDWVITDLAGGGQRLEYKFPGTDTYTKAVFTLRAQLTNAYKDANLAGSGIDNVTFTNTAELHRESYSEGGAIQTDSVDTKMTVQLVGKNGDPLPTNSKRYEWKINVNSYGSRPVRAYAIDTLDTSIHNYVTGGTIIIRDKVTGNTIDTLTMVNLDSDEDFAGMSVIFAGLTSVQLANETTGSQLNGGPFNAASDALGTSQYGYFTYTDGAKTMAALIIPLEKYIGKDIEIVYQTELERTGITEAGGDKVENAVKAVWARYPYGTGSGTYNPEDEFVLNIDKGAPAYNVVRKSADSSTYDAHTQTLTWNFSVNQYRLDVDKVEITDTLDTSKQEFLLYDSHAAIQLTREGGGTRTVPYVTPAAFDAAVASSDEDNDCYTFVTAGTSITFRMYLNGDLSASDYYTFQLKTRLKDTSILSVNTTDEPVYNTASAVITIGTATHGQTAGGQITQWVDNTILTKSNKMDGRDTSYNYSDNTIGWTMIVNNDNVPVKGAVAKDTLPTGTTLGNITKIIRRNGNTVIATVTDPVVASPVTVGDVVLAFVVTDDVTSGNPAYLANTMTITFGDGDTVIDDSFEFQYTTQFTDKSYLENVLSAASLPESIAITNTCEYTAGVVYETGSVVGVNAEAQHKPMRKAIEKTGEFGTETDPESDWCGASYSEWSMIIDPYQADLTGWEVVDAWTPDFYKLDVDSIEIWQADLNSDGTLLATYGTTVTPNNLTTGSKGFSFTIPDSVKNSQLLVRFRTYLVANANKADRQNTVELKGDGVIITSTTNDGGLSDYYISGYFGAGGATYIDITKYSDTKLSGKPFLKLEGAEFQLDEISVNDNIETIATQTTGIDGKATFLFLKKNTLYRVTETEAPYGYATSGPLYWYFKTENGADFATKYDTSAYKNVTITGDKQYSWENAPKAGAQNTGGKIILTKYAHVLGGGEYKLADGITFELSLKDNPSFRKTAMSDENGLVTFDNLDPAEYILKEFVPLQFEDKATWKLVVESDTDNKYTYTLYSGESPDQLTEGKCDIINNYHLGEVILQKRQDDEQNNTLSGAEFEVYATNGGVLVAYLVESASAGTYLLSNRNTKGDKTVDPHTDRYGHTYLQGSTPGNFKLIGGGYSFKETITPIGYKIDDTVHQFTIRTSTLNAQNEIYLTNLETNPSIFTNQFNGGPVELQKRDKDVTGALVTDAEFTVYTSDHIKVAKFVHHENGMYRPAELIPPATQAVTGAPYVHNNTMPLAGDYYFIETKTPAGFWPDFATSAVITQDDIDDPDGDAANAKKIKHGFAVTVTKATTYLTNTGSSSSKSSYFYNDFKDKAVQLTKVDADKVTHKVKGAEFTIYATNSTTPVAMLKDGNNDGVYTLAALGTPAVDSDGVPYVHNGRLLFGDYYYSETTTPAGYMPDYQEATAILKKHHFTVVFNDPDTIYLGNDTNVFKNSVIRNKIKVNKVDAEDTDESLVGAEFTIYGTVGATGQPIATLADNNDGVYVLSPFGGTPVVNPNGPDFLQWNAVSNEYELIYGSYWFAETKAPVGYFADVANASSLLARMYYFSVTDADKTLYLTNANGDSNAAIADTPATVFTNTRAAARAVLNKWDSSDEGGSPSVVVHGAEFTVYAHVGDDHTDHSGCNTVVAKLVEADPLSNTAPAQYVLSSSGVTPTALGQYWYGGDRLVYGEYEFSETVTPDGYLNDTVDPHEQDGDLKRHWFQLDEATLNKQAVDNPATVYLTDDPTGPADKDGAVTNHANGAFINQAKKGYVHLSKHDAGEGAELLSGAVFTVYATSGNLAVAYLVEDGNTGKYLLDVAATGYPAIDPSVATNNENSAYLQYDSLHRRYELIFGEYTLVETTTPTGYMPDYVDQKAETKVLRRHPFTMEETHVYLSNAYLATADTTDNASTNTTINSSFTNRFAGAEVVLKKVVTGTSTPLSGAEFTIYASNGVTPVAYLVESSAAGMYELADISPTSGFITSGKLAYGAYYFKETTAPDGFKRDTAQYNFTLGYENTIADGTNPVTSVMYLSATTPNAAGTSAVTFANSYNTGTVKLQKITEDDTTNAVSGALFTVYASGAQTSRVAFLKESYATPGLYELSNTNGTTTLTETNAAGASYIQNRKLIAGDYYVEETVTPTWYAADYATGTTTLIRHSFTLLNDGDTLYLTNTGTSGTTANFSNRLVRSPIRLNKTVEDTPTPLSGAVFTVYASDGTPVAYLTEGTPQGTYKLNNTSGGSTLSVQDSHGFDYIRQVAGEWQLLKGSYYLVETTTPAGFIDDVSGGEAVKHPFAVSADNTPVYITNSGTGGETSAFTNDYKRGAVQVNKRDRFATTGTLHGAEFTVYATSGDLAIAYLVEDAESGSYVPSATGSGANLAGITNTSMGGAKYLSGGKLLFGQYSIEETVTPTGYNPDYDSDGVTLKRHTLTVGTQGTTYVTNSGTSNDSSSIFTNEAMLGAVYLNKVAAGTLVPLAGAEFTVYERGTDIAVAYLNEGMATAGIYEISAVSLYGAPGFATAANTNGVPYIQNNKLIGGDYDIVETTTPAGYTADTTRRQFEITEDGAVIYIHNQTVENAFATEATTVFTNAVKKTSGGGSGGTHRQSGNTGGIGGIGVNNPQDPVSEPASSSQPESPAAVAPNLYTQPNKMAL